MPWLWRQGKNLTYLTIPEWEAEGIQIGFSTRWGGISKSPYSSLNLGLHVGDHSEEVIKNRKLWFEEWNADFSKVVIGQQVHGVKVYQVKDDDGGKGGLDFFSAIPEMDALMTTTSLGLMAFFADCVPVFFYNPKIQAVAIAHAGWKGTQGKVVQNVLEEMRTLGGNPEDCLVAIGPSIGPCCYEVDQKVISRFQESFLETTFLNNVKLGHAMLNLWEANEILLKEKGVVSENIWTARVCTSCHTDSFFSHRKEGPYTGRMAGWIRKFSKGEKK